MKKRFRGAFVLIPVVYAGVILLLLWLQFSDGQRFYETMNGLTLEGRMTPTVERESSTVSWIRVSYRGIRFRFDDEHPIELTYETGDRRNVVPQSYRTHESGFDIRFESGATVRFELDGSEEAELRIAPEIPRERGPVRAVTLPVSVTRGARFGESSLPGIFPVSFENDTFHLSPPPEARLDTEQGKLEIQGSSLEQAIRYVRAQSPQQDVFATWFTEDRSWITEETYRQSVDQYLDAAYEGWSADRFNGGDGTWDMRSASARFSERILTATLAEAWRRGEYTVVFTDMRRAADQHPDRVSVLSAPYLGNLREIRSRFLEADREKTEALTDLVSAGDPAVFRTADLVTFALDRGSEELYRKVLELAGEADFLSADMASALGMLRNYYLSDLPNEESREAFSRFDAIIEERILPNLYRSEEEGFFLLSSPGRIDVFNSVLAGRILEVAGEARGDRRLISVGRNLVVSGLDLADDVGFLPAVFYVGNGGLEGADGSVGPERLYEILSANPAYPKQISLSEEIGRGSWIWTVADVTRIDISPDRYEFTLEYPRNRTHYVIMQGIPDFARMELFGQQWRNDPSFEAYIKGRHYNATTDTLLIKYTDNSVQGDIILEY